MKFFKDLQTLNNDPEKTASMELVDILEKVASEDTGGRDEYLKKVAEAGYEYGAIFGLDMAEKLASYLKDELKIADGPVDSNPNAFVAEPIGSAAEAKGQETHAPENPNAINNQVDTTDPTKIVHEAAAKTAPGDLKPQEVQYVKAKAQKMVEQLTGGQVPSDEV